MHVYCIHTGNPGPPGGLFDLIFQVRSPWGPPVPCPCFVSCRFVRVFVRVLFVLSACFCVFACPGTRAPYSCATLPARSVLCVSCLFLSSRSATHGGLILAMPRCWFQGCCVRSALVILEILGLFHCIRITNCIYVICSHRNVFYFYTSVVFYFYTSVVFYFYTSVVFYFYIRVSMGNFSTFVLVKCDIEMNSSNIHFMPVFQLRFFVNSMPDVFCLTNGHPFAHFSQVDL